MADKNIIVVLEDHQAMCTFYRDILAPQYEVKCAPNVSDAFDLYEAHKADVVGIISDGHVPGGVLGPDFVRELRTRGFAGPIVGASLTRGLKQSFLDAGANGFTEEKDRAHDILLDLLKKGDSRLA